MKEKLQAKIDEVLESIMAKNAKDISYNEYRILDSKLSTIKWEEEQQNKNKEMAEMFGKAFAGMGCACVPSGSLPDPVKED